MKNRVLLFLFFLMSFSLSAQTKKGANESKNNKQTTAVSKNETTTSVSGDSRTIADKTVREKSAYPVESKTAPAVFYVENDKPSNYPDWKKKLKK